MLSTSLSTGPAQNMAARPKLTCVAGSQKQTFLRLCWILQMGGRSRPCPHAGDWSKVRAPGGRAHGHLGARRLLFGLARGHSCPCLKAGPCGTAEHTQDTQAWLGAVGVRQSCRRGDTLCPPDKGRGRPSLLTLQPRAALLGLSFACQVKTGLDLLQGCPHALPQGWSPHNPSKLIFVHSAHLPR